MRFKKWISVFLAFSMLAGMCSSVHADDESVIGYDTSSTDPVPADITVAAPQGKDAYGLDVAPDTSVTIPGDIETTATGNKQSGGIWVIQDDNADVTVHGDVSVSSAGSATGVLVRDEVPNGSEVSVYVGGDVTTVSTGYYETTRYRTTSSTPCGVFAVTPDQAEIEVHGDVESVASFSERDNIHKEDPTWECAVGAYGAQLCPNLTSEASVEVTVGGSVTADTEYEGPNDFVIDEYAYGAEILLNENGGNAKLTVGGDVNAYSDYATGVSIYQSDFGDQGGSAQVQVGDDICAEGNAAVGLSLYLMQEGAEGTVHVDQDINVTSTRSDAKGIQFQTSDDDLSAVESIEGGSANVVVNGNINVTTTDQSGGWTSGIEAFNTNGECSVETGGKITVSGDEQNFGVFVSARGESETTVLVDKGIDVSGNGFAFGVKAATWDRDSAIDITVNEDINAEAAATTDSLFLSLTAEGLDIDNKDGTIQATVNGDITAKGGDASGMFVLSGFDTKQEELGAYTGEIKDDELVDEYYSPRKDNSQAPIYVKEYYNAEQDLYYRVYFEDEDYTVPSAVDPDCYRQVQLPSEGGKTEITVHGDIQSEYSGIKLWLENKDIQTDILVDGTVAGEEQGIQLYESDTIEGLTLTVWKVEKNDRGNIAEYSAGYDEATDTVQYERSEAMEKEIQYIIRLDQPVEGGTLATDGTTEYQGYQVAHENDVVYLKVNLAPDYEITDAYNGAEVKVSLLKDENGQYYLVVPKGGGVLLSVSLRKKEPEKSEQQNNRGTSDNQPVITVAKVSAVPDSIENLVEEDIGKKSISEAAATIADALKAEEGVISVEIEEADVFSKMLGLPSFSSLSAADQLYIILTILGQYESVEEAIARTPGMISEKGMELIRLAKTNFDAGNENAEKVLYAQLLQSLIRKVTVNGKETEVLMLTLRVKTTNTTRVEQFGFENVDGQWILAYLNRK